MLEYEVNVKIQKIRDKFTDLHELFDTETVIARIAELEQVMIDPDFWNDQKKAETVSRETEHLKSEMAEFKELAGLFEDLDTAIELASEDPTMEETALETLKIIEEKTKDFELKMLLSDSYDGNNAFVTIHPGAGGTESQDWASMLLRMYIRWAEIHKFKIEMVEYLDGDEAGIKSATVKLSGPFAYGKLKYESGVHRLVRISPFDSNARRHTSFSSVSVMPEVDDSIEIEIREEDLRMDTYRAGGAGGQYVNKTDSAVRLTHMPSGIVVACQIERNQHQNRLTAMNMLRAKLYERELQKQMEEKMKLKGDIKEISWGNQIRSYVLYPYQMIKDHRTDCESANSQAVLDGVIDSFIEAELLYFAGLEK